MRTGPPWVREKTNGASCVSDGQRLPSAGLPVRRSLGRCDLVLAKDPLSDLHVLVAKHVPQAAVEGRSRQFACGNGPANLRVANANALASQTSDEIAKTHFSVLCI
jgi:hypothetical protein